MKETCAMVLSAVMAMSLAGCGGSKAAESTAAATQTQAESSETTAKKETESETSQEAAAEEKTELIVFAAASMTETMTKIAEMYKEVKPIVEIVYTFDSSGTLKTQIEEGADCDIFISAAQKQMNRLDISAAPSVNTDGLDFVDGKRLPFRSGQFRCRPFRPILAGFEYFYPRSNSGGMILLHDYNNRRFRGSAQAVTGYESIHGSLPLVPLCDLHGS